MGNADLQWIEGICLSTQFAILKSQMYIPTETVLRDFPKHRQLLQTGPGKSADACHLFSCLFKNSSYAYWQIYPLNGRAERLTERNVVCWKSCAKFEGCWREMVVMEWAGKGCDSSIECVGARWIGLICLWMEPFHYSC